MSHHDSALASASSRARNMARERDAIRAVVERAGVEANPVRVRRASAAELADLRAKAARHRPTRGATARC